MSKIKDRVNSVRQRSGMEEAYLLALRELERQEIKLSSCRAALSELYAMVQGECPSLLNEDSGGTARLDIAIQEALSDE